MTPDLFGTGYRQLPDPRDQRFPLGALMKAGRERPISKVWKTGPKLNQRDSNSCVGHAAFQFQASEPVVLAVPLLTAFDIYDEARHNDEWPMNDDLDEGTSIRAGLEVLRRHGIVKSYHWLESPDQAPEYLLEYGPLIFGTRWTDSMFYPHSDGRVTIHRGFNEPNMGHAYFAYAADWKAQTITCQNSYGPEWGKGGDFLLSFAQARQLLSEPGSSAAAVLEA